MSQDAGIVIEVLVVQALRELQVDRVLRKHVQAFRLFLPRKLLDAIRYDRASSYAPSELNGTLNTSFLNPQPITIQRTPGVDAYNDITPRVGVAYDLFGNSRTAVKFNWGRYLAYAAKSFCWAKISMMTCPV